MKIVVHQGSWRCAASDAQPPGFALWAEGDTLGRGERHLVVELLMDISPMRPHGLLAVEYHETSRPLFVNAHGDGDFRLSAPPQRGLLDEQLRLGLPTDYAEIAGRATEVLALEHGLSTGEIRLVGGGLTIDSSPEVFRRLGLLAGALLAAGPDGDQMERVTQALMEDW